MRSRLWLIGAIAGATLFASCAAAGAASLYVPSYGEYEPEVVNGYERGTDGAPSLIGGSPFAVGPPVPPSLSGLNAIAFAPDGTRGVASFLFKGGVLGLSVAPDGPATPVPGPTLTPSINSLAVSPDGRFAYVTTRDFMMVPGVGIIGYSLGGDGSLSALPTSPFGGTDEYGDVAMTPDGRFLFSVTGGDVERFSVDAGGSLDSLGSTDLTDGPRFLTVSPDGRFLFATLEGGEQDSVVSLAIGSDGSLTQVGPPFLSPDNGIEGLTVTPDGRRLYVAEGELDAILNASVAADGSLTALAAPVPAGDASTVAAAPDGRFLYFGDDDTVNGFIGVASIGADGSPVVLPFKAPWISGTIPIRIVFQPGPAPVAAFAARPGAPGGLSSFDARSSARAARYEWDFGDGTRLMDGGPTPTHRYEKAGVYPVVLTVFDRQGCSVPRVYTGQSTSCPGGASATTTTTLDTLPAITALSVSRKKFKVGPAKASAKGKTGTVLRFTLTEKAKVRFTIAKRKSGRRVGRNCRPRTAANRGRKACPLFSKRGTIQAAGRDGANRKAFAGKLRGRALAPGRYRATAIATDSANGHSAPRSVFFQVLGER